jgi:hypothetical protein
MQYLVLVADAGAGVDNHDARPVPGVAVGLHVLDGGA